MDIATAKATPAERASAAHHLLDVAQPAGRPFTVVDFRDAALPIVDALLSAGEKVPIVVGGTNYYIESLLWQVLVSPPQTTGDKRAHNGVQPAAINDIDLPGPTSAKRANIDDDTTQPADSTSNSVDVRALSDDAIQLLPTGELHTMLAAVDAPQAVRLHPNNRRKIVRALQVFRDCGQPLSAILTAQQCAPGGSGLGGPLRYEHVVLLWLRCDQTVLEARLDARIDAMVSLGLLAEIRQFHDEYVGGETNIDGGDYTKGIMQTIGFKEFIPYLSKYDRLHDQRITDYMRQQSDNADAIVAPPDGVDVLNACLDELRLVTKRYAKKQQKWVRNRFLDVHSSRHVPPVFELDSSNAADWQRTVFQRAERIVEEYMSATPSPSVSPMPKQSSRRGGLAEDVTNVCDVCERTFIGEFQWRIHQRSNKHKRAVERRRKNQQTNTDEVAGHDLVRASDNDDHASK